MLNGSKPRKQYRCHRLKSLRIKCLRLEGSKFRLGGIAPITRAVPSFLALNERIFLMRLAVSDAWQNSPGHFQTMIDPGCDCIGVGVTQYNGITY